MRGGEKTFLRPFFKGKEVRVGLESPNSFEGPGTSCHALVRIVLPRPSAAMSIRKRSFQIQCIHLQGSKNLFCASRRTFRAEPGRHFSGRIFFHLGRNRAPRLKSLGAKKNYLWCQLLHTPQNEHHQWNDSNFFFWQWQSMKSKKKERKKERKKLLRKNLGPLHSLETRRGRGRSC